MWTATPNQVARTQLQPFPFLHPRIPTNMKVLFFVAIFFSVTVMTYGAPITAKECFNDIEVSKFYSCQCFFVMKTHRTPVSPDIVFTTEEVCNFLITCRSTFGNTWDFQHGCIDLAETKRFNRRRSIAAMVRFADICFNVPFPSPFAWWSEEGRKRSGPILACSIIWMGSVLLVVHGL